MAFERLSVAAQGGNPGLGSHRSGDWECVWTGLLLVFLSARRLTVWSPDPYEAAATKSPTTPIPLNNPSQNDMLVRADGGKKGVSPDTGAVSRLSCWSKIRQHQLAPLLGRSAELVAL
jgi:hypothetical protein